MAGVQDAGCVKMAHFQVVWGKLDSLDASRGVCDTAGSMFLCSWALVHVPEGDRAGDMAIINGHVVGDVACHIDM